MAVYSTLDIVLKQMERSNAKFWWVSDSDGTPLADYKTTEGTIEDSFLELENLVKAQQGDYLIVKIRQKLPNINEETGAYSKGGATTKAGSIFVYRVRIEPVPGTQRNGQQSNNFDNGLHGLYTMVADLKAQNIETAKNAEIAALKKELDEAKKDEGKGSNTDKMMKHIADRLVSHFVPGKNGNGKTEIADSKEVGYVYSKKNEAAEEKTPQEKAANVSEDIGRVAEVMGDKTYALLKKLGDMAKENPDEFKQQAEMIMGE